MTVILVHDRPAWVPATHGAHVRLPADKHALRRLGPEDCVVWGTPEEDLPLEGLPLGHLLVSPSVDVVRRARALGWRALLIPDLEPDVLELALGRPDELVPLTRGTLLPEAGGWWEEGRRVALPAKERAVAASLVAARGRPVSRDVLAQALGIEPGSRAPDTVVRQLRSRFGAEHVQTVRGAGWRLLAAGQDPPPRLEAPGPRPSAARREAAGGSPSDDDLTVRVGKLDVVVIAALAPLSVFRAPFDAADVRAMTPAVDPADLVRKRLAELHDGAYRLSPAVHEVAANRADNAMRTLHARHVVARASAALTARPYSSERVVAQVPDLVAAHEHLIGRDAEGAARVAILLAECRAEAGEPIDAGPLEAALAAAAEPRLRGELLLQLARAAGLDPDTRIRLLRRSLEFPLPDPLRRLALLRLHRLLPPPARSGPEEVTTEVDLVLARLRLNVAAAPAHLAAPIRAELALDDAAHAGPEAGLVILLDALAATERARFLGGDCTERELVEARRKLYDALGRALLALDRPREAQCAFLAAGVASPAGAGATTPRLAPAFEREEDPEVHGPPTELRPRPEMLVARQPPRQAGSEDSTLLIRESAVD